MLGEKLLRLFEWMGMAYMPDERFVRHGLKLNRESITDELSINQPNPADGGKDGRVSNRKNRKKAVSASEADRQS